MTTAHLPQEGRSLSRRSLLALAGAAAVTPVLGGFGQPAAAAPGRPSGAGYVRYEDLYRSGDTLQRVIEKVTGNRILTLPNGSFSIADFRNGYYSGICHRQRRRCGLSRPGGVRAGHGDPGSGQHGYPPGVGGESCGSQISISNKQWAVLSNFTLKGGPQNGRIYDGIKVASCPDARLTWLYLKGGSRGYSQSPPGETFGINVLRSDRVKIFDSEVDGRDDSGTRVASSPIGWNYGRDAAVIRTYAHHGVAGMLTFFDTTNVYTEDYHSFSTGSGSGTKSGHGINHEQSQGLIRHIRPKLYVNGIYSRVAGSTSFGQHALHVRQHEAGRSRHRDHRPAVRQGSGFDGHDGDRDRRWLQGVPGWPADQDGALCA